MRTRSHRVRADKAYSSRAIRTSCAVVASPQSSRTHPTRSPNATGGAHAGGRPPGFNAQDYKGRNVIERGFNLTRQWRGLATRYDKLAVV